MLHLSRAREPRAPPYPFVIIFLIDVNEKKNKTWALGYNGHCARSHFHPIVFALLCGSFIDNESFVSHCNGQDHRDLSILILTIWRYVEEGWCGGGRGCGTCGGRGSLRLSQACLRAALGVILAAGSHSRHRRMKSRNSGSSHPFSAVCSSREPGGPRGLPRRDLPPFSTVVPSGNVVAVQYRG